MRKSILVLFLLIGSGCSAQGLSVGLKAGANISSFSGGDFGEVNKKSIVGFVGGGFLNISLGALSLQPEALVSTQGARIDSANRSYDWKVTYASFPVLLKYRLAGSFFLEAGPQFGFKLNENITDETIEDFANDLDLSAAIGVGVQTITGLGVGVRYLIGLSKVGDFNPSNSIDPDFKNSVIQISVFVRFGN